MARSAGVQNPVAGLESALFGRFVTSDILSRVDAPVHVAHAFTTHALDTEVDFFTVVDDLLEDEETGAAHANDAELGAGIFFGYIAVDVPLLISNLTGCERATWKEQDPSDAREVLNLLIHAAAKVSPGAKLGATAPYARAECVVLEAGTSQPRSLANAYLKAVRFSANGSHPMGESVQAMGDYLTRLEHVRQETKAGSTLHGARTENRSYRCKPLTEFERYRVHHEGSDITLRRYDELRLVHRRPAWVYRLLPRNVNADRAVVQRPWLESRRF